MELRFKMKLIVTNHVITWHGKYIVSTQDFSCWNLQQSLHSKQQKHFCSEPVSPFDDFCLMASFSSFSNFFNVIIIIIISVHIHWCTNFCTSFHPVSVGCLLPMDAAIFGSSCHFRHPARLSYQPPRIKNQLDLAWLKASLPCSKPGKQKHFRKKQL